MLYFYYKRCERVIKKNSESFYKAFSLIENRKKRNAIYAIYAFCRYADDVIDVERNERKLNHLEQQLKNFETKRIQPSYLWKALNDVFKHYSVSYLPFYDMINGQRMDVYKHEYDTFEELKKYCSLVASSVGEMLLPIVAEEHHQDLSDVALHLGYAMQLTNILRDVGEDFQSNRIYLPKEWLQQENYTIDDFMNSTIDERFIAIWEKGASFAEFYFDSVLNKMNLFSEDSLDAVYISLLIYRGILQACREKHYQVFTKKNYVTTSDKLKIIQQYYKMKGKE